MSNDHFAFKRFTVRQAGAAMKVGTDGTLLGAWARVSPEHRRILDIGTGTGLIALMLAQRSEAAGSTIDAIDIDESSCRQARENFEASPWNDRLRAIHSGLEEYVALHERSGSLPYDHIISNPPYFNDSLISPHPGRTAARHTASLPHTELAANAAKLLSATGCLSVILPAESRDAFTAIAARHDLVPMRETTVFSKPGTQPKRVMMEFRFAAVGESSGPELSQLTIETDIPGRWSDEYCKLTRDFYLKL